MTHRQRPPSLSGDRNVRVLRAHAHEQFVERVRAGLVKPQDRFSKPLEVGDLVLWHPTMDPCCQILSIEALPLDRQPPEGSAGVMLMMGITVNEAVDIRQPAIFFAKVGHVEAPPAKGNGNGQSSDKQAPAEPPPADSEPPDDSPS